MLLRMSNRYLGPKLTPSRILLGRKHIRAPNGPCRRRSHNASEGKECTLVFNQLAREGDEVAFTLEFEPIALLSGVDI